MRHVSLLGSEGDIIDTRASRLEEAAEAFRGYRVFCLVFILCVYPFTKSPPITLQPKTERKKRGSVPPTDCEEPKSLHNENMLETCFFVTLSVQFISHAFTCTTLGTVRL